MLPESIFLNLQKNDLNSEGSEIIPTEQQNTIITTIYPHFSLSAFSHSTFICFNIYIILFWVLLFLLFLLLLFIIIFFKLPHFLFLLVSVIFLYFLFPSTFSYVFFKSEIEGNGRNVNNFLYLLCLFLFLLLRQRWREKRKGVILTRLRFLCISQRGGLFFSPF